MIPLGTMNCCCSRNRILLSMATLSNHDDGTGECKKNKCSTDNPSQCSASFFHSQ